MDEKRSKDIAGLVGPAVVLMVLAEFPLIQPGLYDRQTPTVVYLSGVLFFVAGLAIVRKHNLWSADWRVLVTIFGWLFLLLGVVRMFTATRYGQAAASWSTAAYVVGEVALILLGMLLTYKAYRKPGAT